jgi:hypothetical protein
VLHYYVYYRVNPHRQAEAGAAVRQMQYEIEAETGIAGRLLQKRGEPHLWMEIYENVASGETLEHALAGAADKVGFQRLLQERSTRRMECFQG